MQHIITELETALVSELKAMKYAPALATDIVSDAKRTIAKIAKAKVDLDRAKLSMRLIARGVGYDTPLIFLGISPPPKNGAAIMANIRIASFKIDREEYLKALEAAVK